MKSLRHPRVFIFQQPGGPPRSTERAIVVPEGEPHRRWASQPSFDAPLAAFDDVKDGDSLPLFQRYTDLMNFNRFAAVNDEYVYHHMDVDIANNRGQKDVDGMGLLQFSYLHNMLRQWIGEEGDITRASVQYRANNGRGDIVSCQGRVLRKYQENALNLVDLDLWTQNQHGETLSLGAATVSLPGKRGLRGA